MNIVAIKDKVLGGKKHPYVLRRRRVHFINSANVLQSDLIDS